MKKAAVIAIIIAILTLAIIVFARVNVHPQENSVVTAAPAETPAATPSLEPTVRPSEVYTVTYKTTNRETGETAEKEMAVYLPEAYDANGQYNAVFLMHVAGSDENFWPGLGIQSIMDELIASGAVEPMLLFMPDGYVSDAVRGNRNDPRIYTQFAAEFREDLLPFVKQNYAVCEGREHLGIYGASFGAYLTVNSILRPNLDLVSNFGITGGGTIDLNELEQGWQDSGNADLDIAMFYIGEGDRDDRGPVELSYMTLRDHCDKFNEDNLKFTLMEGVGHDETEWIEGLKEALQLFNN